MHGNLHIFRLDTPDRPGDEPGHQYQANYTVPGKTYTKVYTEAKLKDFLHSAIGLTEDSVFRIIKQLRDTGKSTLPDVDFTGEDIGGLDFDEVPVDV